MLSILKKTWKFIKKLGVFFNSQALDIFIDVLEKIAPHIDRAYPIVKRIAELTPTTADDYVLAAYEELGFKDLFDPTMDTKTALRELAKVLFREKINEEGEELPPDHIINSSIELAYAQYKATEESTNETV